MNALLQRPITGQAEIRPQSIALVLGDQSVTYAELETWSNQLARLLKAAGCRRGDRVCLLLPKSIPAIVGILGTLKADCIYVPMDITHPASRLRTVIQACEARCVLALGASATPLMEVLADPGLAADVRVGWMEPAEGAPGHLKPHFHWNDRAAFSGEPLDYQNTSDDVAHILFTSGSTGVPKGVTITHANVISFLKWSTKYFGTSPSDRISGHPPLHFDLSTFDVYGTLSNGAQLYLVTPDMCLLPHKLAQFMRSSELTQWFSVPSLLTYMARFDVVKENDFPSMRRLLWCGEPFPTPALIYWMKRLPHVSFTNLYGPTETTIASSYYRVPECPADNKQSIPIGTACEGEELLVLDDDLKPIPPGQIGQLYIGGVGLSPGYWRDPEKTRAAFLPNPYSRNAGDRIYKTGDLASTGPDGLVYLHGRADSQIKSRGYRIELGEIEKELNAIEELRECAVVAVDLDGFEGVAIACAYVPAGEAEITPQNLRKRLSGVLPHYMVPTHWISLATLPHNANGKIDRGKLREQFRTKKGLQV